MISLRHTTVWGALILLLGLAVASGYCGCSRQRSDPGKSGADNTKQDASTTTDGAAKPAQVPNTGGRDASNPSQAARADGPIDTTCKDLVGTLGMSAEWKSGWLDLAAPTDFKAGDRLELAVAGAAKQILVRLLKDGVSADSPAGVDGVAIAVPKNHVVVIWLQSDHKSVAQVSVHGGPNPWGQYALGANNGSVSLRSVCAYRH